MSKIGYTVLIALMAFSAVGVNNLDPSIGLPNLKAVIWIGGLLGLMTALTLDNKDGTRPTKLAKVGWFLIMTTSAIIGGSLGLVLFK